MNSIFKSLACISLLSTTMAGTIYEVELKVDSNYQLKTSLQNKLHLINDTSSETHTLLRRDISNDRLEVFSKKTYGFNDDSYLSLDVNGQASDNSNVTFKKSYSFNSMAEKDSYYDSLGDSFSARTKRALYYNVTRPAQIDNLRAEVSNEYVSVSDQGVISFELVEQVNAKVSTSLILGKIKELVISKEQMQRVNENKLMAESALIKKSIKEQFKDNSQRVDSIIIKSIESDALRCKKEAQAYFCTNFSKLNILVEVD